MSLRPRAHAPAAAAAAAPRRSRLHQVLSVGVEAPPRGVLTEREMKQDLDDWPEDASSEISSSDDEQDYEERDWRRNPPDRGYQSGVPVIVEVEEKELVRLQRELFRSERALERCETELETKKAELKQRVQDGYAAGDLIRDLEKQLSVSELHNQRAQEAVKRLQLVVAAAEAKLANCNDRCAED